MKLLIRKEIDFYILRGDKLNNTQIANIMKLVCDRAGFDRQVQVHLHEQKLPGDSDHNTYYLTLQVVNKFKSEWKIKRNSSNKTFVDLEELLPAMVPTLVKVKVVRKLDKNAMLSARIFLLFCVIMIMTFGITLLFFCCYSFLLLFFCCCLVG